MEETLTVTRLGITGKLKLTLQSTNPIESMISTVRVIHRNVKHWSSGEMCLRWTAAGMLEAETRFRKVAGYRGLANLAIAKTGRPTLVITPTIDLMNQWYDELTLSFGVEAGLLGGGYYEIQPLTVTTYDSAYLNMDRLGNRFGFIVFDECHHLPGPTYMAAAVGSLAPFRLGLTATPERADGQEALLPELIGPQVYRREIKQLAGEFLAEFGGDDA